MSKDSKIPLRNVQEYIKTPLLYNHWYVAGFSEEFDQALKARTLLNRSIVFYRKENGELVALQNRCVHRSYPLSEGKRIGDNLQCAYHGICFSPEGNIVHVPCQEQLPNAKVRAYPIHETGPLVWIWMGEGEGDIAQIPDMTCLMDEGWVNSKVHVKKVPGNYLLMHDNLADLSHLPYIHGSLVPFSEELAAKEIHLEVDDKKKSVNFYRNNEWEEISQFYPTLDWSDKKVAQKSGLKMVTPAFCYGWDRLETIEEDAGTEPVHLNYYLHLLTPETDKTTYYWYVMARNHGLENNEYTESMLSTLDMAYQQDVDACDHLQKLLDTDQHSVSDLILSIDRPGMAVRKIILEMAEQERLA